MLEVTPARAFRDNYIWLIHAPQHSRSIVIVDPGDARPVIEAIELNELTPIGIFATHHHPDHVGGVSELVERFNLEVWGPAGEHIPCRTHALREGDSVDLSEFQLRFQVIDIPGHTSGHIAYHGHGALFCGDTLFSAGCGRLFEGTPTQMTDSLNKLKSLPDDTRVYCGHEYTLANLRFAQCVEPENDALNDYLEASTERRASGVPTLPSTIAMERQVNPFLRCDQPAVRASAEAHAGRSLPDEVDVFAIVRAWKDRS